jgi:Cu/Ag efflux protein CusF
VDGKKTAVVSTLKDAGALVTLDHDNLYDMSIVNIPDGSYKFKVTPTAKLGDTVVNGESVTLQITVSGGVITVTK